jgi:hypothetical protein
MVATLLVIVAALVIAVFGCAWVGPIGDGRADRSTPPRRT